MTQETVNAMHDADTPPAGQALRRVRLPESAARSLPSRVPPAWVYLHGLKSPLSSTALRAARSRKIDAETSYAVSPGTPAG